MSTIKLDQEMFGIGDVGQDVAFCNERGVVSMLDACKAGRRILPMRFEDGVPFEIYRCSTLGQALLSSLQELKSEGKVSESLAEKILVSFDTHFALKIANVAPQMRLYCRIKNYRDVSRIYHIILSDLEIWLAGVGGKDRLNMILQNTLLIAYPSENYTKQRTLKRNQKGSNNNKLGSNKKTWTNPVTVKVEESQ